ncbi:MAG: hypothetical protein MUF58_12240 [Arcicella sp.]|jgi:histidyl-tRNA synthetase|nr:hypothetical protein [Arcicella sp.]
MAEPKKGLGLKGTTNLATPELAKKESLKSTVPNDEIVEKTVQQIHNSSSKMVRLSFDVTPEMYDKIKRKQLDKGLKTTRQYLLDLVETDIA